MWGRSLTWCRFAIDIHVDLTDMVNDVVANNSILDGRPTFCQRKTNVFVVILMSLLLVSLLVVSAAASGGQHGARKPLTDSIRHYETLSYDTNPVKLQHERLKRATTSAPHLHLSFHAFDRDFSLDLTPSRQVFAPGVKFLLNKKETTGYDPRTFYQGRVVGDVKSRVSGHVMDGVFDGTITTSEGEYHVEHAHKFFSARERRDFHSVVYRTSDVNFEHSESSCAAKGELLEQMRRLQSTARPIDKHGGTISEYLVNRGKQKRATVNGGTFCSILVAADHLFLQEVGGGDPAATTSEIVTTMAQVQEIYRNTDFDGDGRVDNIVPSIERVDILNQNDPGYRFSAGITNVNTFLDLWSQEDQTDFCLALLLTYRDFANGVLGLAWVAEPAGGNRGGICEGRVQLQVGERSLNTAIVTYLNYGQRQPRPVTVITITHEFGHNFGSPHDPSTATCSPGAPNGNFIMFPRATDGQQPNNRMFSSCSRSSINAVLAARNSDCFTNGSFCGDGILEDGEECDCGRMCSQDSCCNTDCTLTPGAQCSSLQPCCDGSCQFLNNTVMCRERGDCAAAAMCTGDSGVCPASEELQGPCNNGRSSCVDGLCSGSVCLNNGLEDCQCTENQAQLCHVCCTVNGLCQSTFSLSNMNIEGQNREPGRSCNDFQGYCSNDSPPRCLGVDNEETLNDLRNIFTLGTLNNIVAWLSVYWYIPVIIVVALIILMILLHFTYRKRKPLKRRFSQARRSIRRERGPSHDAADGPRGEQRRRAGPQQITHREAINRLRRFFPTADAETVISVQQASVNEAKAVKRLLELGFPLRKIPIPRA